MGKDRRTSLSGAAGLVANGAKIGFGGSIGLYRRPVEFARELIRQRKVDLHVFGILSGFEADLLIGAGCVASTNTSYVGFDELGQAPNFQRAAGDGSIEVNEYGEWMITAGYRAANMALPYLPWVSGRYTDMGERLGLKEIECPYTGQPLLAVRALNLDVAVIQVPRCDAEGNTEIPLPLEHMYDVDALIARSAETVIVCAEEIGEVDPNRVQLIAREVDAVVEVPKGAWPGGLHPLYGIDRAHITDTYVPAVRDGNFSEYLDRYVFAEGEVTVS
jgi:glutaconate CoA-transferase, subunit A